MRSEIVLSRELLPPGSRVLCAVSGGADSVCLLHLVRALGDVECLCAHYDHALRPESAEDAAFVEALCGEWGIPFFTERGDAATFARRTGESIETAARTLRYDFMRRTAKACGADRIATAHNMNDNAETVLFHMARGSGLRGLTGIPEERDGIVRPLLRTSRREIEAYLFARGIPHREDATNALDIGSRNYLRHHALPALEQAHPGATENISRMTRLLKEDEAFFDSLAGDWLRGQAPGEISSSALAALPGSVARRVLRLWLGEDLSAERTEAVLALCSAAPSARLDLPGGRRICRRNDALVIGEQRYLPLPEREISPGQTVPLPEAGLCAECVECASGEEIHNSFHIFCFSYDELCDKLRITARQPGDEILLSDREGTRSLKKLFIERAVPRSARESVPVLRDGRGVLAVYGIGRSRRAAAVSGKPFIKIIFRPLAGEE